MTLNRIAFLGVKGGPAIKPGSCMPTSFLLHLNDTPIVIDCGLGVTRGLVDQGFSLKELSTIFISHCHSDHYLELGPLIHTAWTAGLKSPVTVYGPPQIESYWNYFYQSMIYDIELRMVDEGRPSLKDLVTIETLSSAKTVNIEGITVSALRNSHPPIVESFALRFDSAHLRVVYSGDTRYFEPLIHFARDADLLVHEVMLIDAVDALCRRVGNGDDRLKKHLMRSHTPVEDAAKVAQVANVKKLAFCHYVPGDIPFIEEDWTEPAKRNYDGLIVAPRDGDVIELAPR